jgi:hypothetical protein
MIRIELTGSDTASAEGAEVNYEKRARGRWWSACSLTATRDPGVRCSYFLDSNRGVADGQGDRS